MGNVLVALGLTLSAAALLLLIPSVVLLVEVCAARHLRGTVGPSSVRRPALAVLIPAHNEAAGIAVAIRAVAAQLSAADRLLVVADNCSDDTAAVAMNLGAEVIERNDLSLRGKGYALDYGVRHLEKRAPELVVIVDADCDVHPGALDRLAEACVHSGRPVQATYLMRSPDGAPLKTRIGEFAWLLHNQVRPLGGLRLGWPCQLMGTGMAFPWSSIRGAALATGHIVEDMQLGIDLAIAGTAPLFCGDALVTSVFPEREAALLTQRTRWEHGHLGTIASQVPRMLAIAVAQRRGMLAAMALDLAVPPLSSLAIALFTVIAAALLVAVLGGSGIPLVISAVAAVSFAVAVFGAWVRFARSVLSGRDWIAVPRYLLAKLPMYARLFTARQVEWVRTKRKVDSSD